jgi:hypothetical protein
MDAEEVVLRGNLRKDGTLELIGTPSLPPGPVVVTLRVAPERPKPGEDWWQYLQRARAALEAAGHKFRTGEEIDAELNAMRDEWEERMRELDAIRGDHPPGGAAT